MDFGLIFFSNAGAGSDSDKYRLLIESARFADANGFSSVWVPERHFTRDGGLYPNPAVLQAAIALQTTRIALRAGSVVMPLHNPVRVAEEWAVVDNLSGGRVGISFASGWHPDDFMFFPERYAGRQEEMYRGIATVQKLWRGEAIEAQGGNGERIKIKTCPQPIQPELPVWITAAGDPKTFAAAGRLNAGVLTHMFNQSIEELAQKIQTYRDSLAEHGHDPSLGRVALMLHTFVSDQYGEIGDEIQNEFCAYLKSASYLLNAIAYHRGQHTDLARLSPQDVDDYVRFVFNRLVSERRVLFGTADACVETVTRLKAIGVSEIACQLDFGVETDLALKSLPSLARLKELCEAEERQTRRAQPHAPSPASKPQPNEVLDGIRARCTQEVSRQEFYERLRTSGIQFGSAFQGIQGLWRCDGEALGLVRLPAALEPEANLYGVHPAFLDACFQVLIAALPAERAGESIYLPVGLRRCQMHSVPGSETWSHARLRTHPDSVSTLFEGDVRLLDNDGKVLLEATGLRFRRMDLALPANSQPDLADFLYEIEWRQSPRIAQEQPSLKAGPGTWLVLADRGGIGKALAVLLEASGHKCVLAFAEKAGQSDPNAAEGIPLLLAGAGKADDLLGVIHLWGLDSSPPERTTVELLQEDQQLGCGAALKVIQEISQQSWKKMPRLWLATRGATAAAGDHCSALAQSPLWGFGRASAQEQPGLWGGMVDLPPNTSEKDAAALLCEEILHPSAGEDQVAFRRGQRYVARFARRRGPMEETFTLASQPASYLITGGLGDLGLEVARWLAQHGARHLLLLGRSGLPPRSGWNAVEKGSRLAGQIAAIQALEAAGVKVYTASVDVADEAQMRAALEASRAQGWPQVRGVVHSAAVVRGATLLTLDRSMLEAVMRPKMLGGWVLHRLFAHQPLDFMVFFSAIPALLGQLGQGAANYAAANAFLDALAHYRRARGLHAISINWGPWSKIGMAARAGDALERMAWQGVRSIPPEKGHHFFGLTFSMKQPQCAVVAVNWPQFFQAWSGAAESKLLSDLRQEHSRDVPDAGSVPAKTRQIAKELLAADSGQRKQMLDDYVLREVARVLKTTTAKLDVQQPLTNLGLDSLMAIELKNKVEIDLGITLSMVMFLQGPSIAQLTAQVLSQIESDAFLLSAAQGPRPAITGISQADAAEREKAQELLATLDELTDDDVDSLLTVLRSEDGNSTA
jgi:phthiocerol/phenolphthiocerol synthesis type-I polyketide synthase D